MQQEEIIQATAVPATASGSTPPAQAESQSICVRYKGNQSKRWDGNVVKIGRDWLGAA